MEFWSNLKQDSEKVSSKVSIKVSMQDGTFDYSELQNAENPIPQVLENQEILHNKNFVCNNTQKENSIKKWAVQNSNL